MEKPTKERIAEAIGVIENYILYLKEAEPYATNTISILENAIDQLL